MFRAVGLLLVLSALVGSVLLAQEPKKEPELTKEERAKLEAEATERSEAGVRQYHNGKLGDAENNFRHALQLREKLYPESHFPAGHPKLAIALNNLGYLLQAQGRLAQAEPFFRKALTIRQKLYPAGHPDLAQSLHNLAGLLRDQGQFTRAEPLLREALTVLRRQYPPDRFPNGHPTLVYCLNDLGLVLQAQNHLAQAESFLRDALAMQQKLYPLARSPEGEPMRAYLLNNLAVLLYDREMPAQAEPLLREALAARQKLYPPAQFPDGHPLLATNLLNLAMMLRAQAKLAQAEAVMRDTLAMYRKIYPTTRFPDGHPLLARALHNLSVLLLDQEKVPQAEEMLRDALTMYRRLAISHAELRPEGETLVLLAAQPGSQHLYLTALRRQPTLIPQRYAMLWANRGMLTRLAEQKRLTRRAGATHELRQLWTELVNLRRQRAHMLLAPRPSGPEAAEVHNEQLQTLDKQINALAAQAQQKLPALRGEQSAPVNLQKVLPPQSLFIDLMRHSYFESQMAQPDRLRDNRSPRYVAFLVTRENVQWVDLGPAEPLEAAFLQWREEVTTKNVISGREHPNALRRLLWEPLEKHFPPGTTTVYLCPDRMLCFLPWGALPGKKADTVLLEEYSLAIVPHGPYLLGQLLGTQEKETKENDLLVLGGVKYDDTPVQTLPVLDRGNDDPKAAPVQAAKGGWRYLPGTAAEAEAIRNQAEHRQFKTQYLSAHEAGTERFKQELPKARIAHLATHGFFADPKFRSVFQWDEKHFAMRGQERVGAGALLPSLLSGLVFAGANRPETPGRGIVTAEELFDLDLTGMELAVLSACETGLGEVGGGEGVFGLQRAFHVAGCQNVIASLWKVNDVATMVLMEEFYRNLWEKKLTKREALRQAQLTVYRNPDLVLKRRDELRAEMMKAGATKEQLAQRGIDDEATPLPVAGPGAPRRSPPSWWAAFLLSGLGE